VNYALVRQALLVFDAAYEAYIADPTLPHSIYEIPGARDCAIEFRSFSKQAGSPGALCLHRRSEVRCWPVTREASGARCIRSGCGARPRSQRVSYIASGPPRRSTRRSKAQVRQLIRPLPGNARVLREGARVAGSRSLAARTRVPVGPSAGGSYQLAGVDKMLNEANV